MADFDNPLQPVVGQWMAKIRKAAEFKNQRFGKDADESMRFFVGAFDWVYKGVKNDRHFQLVGEMTTPTFQMSLNKTAELVQLFGPSLYARNPVRTVNPRKWIDLPPTAFGDVQMDPAAAMMYQQAAQVTQQGRATDATRAQIYSALLNYTPNALDLKTQSRWAIDEAIIKGMGLLWPQVYRSPGAKLKCIGSFFKSVDNLLIDPDATSLLDAKVVYDRCIHPVWEVERMFGLPEGSVRGNMESANRAAEVENSEFGDYWRKRGQTNDLLVYWKVFSKMGAGGRLEGIATHLREPLDQFGDYCYIVVCDTLAYPLNVPPALIDSGDMAAVQKALQWPIPLWADGGWPFAKIAFHDVPNDPWPMCHLAPAMGELKFLNWAYSFLAGKIAITSRDFLAVQKGLAEEIKSQITSGKDLTLLEIEREHGTIAEVVQFLQHPQFNGDIWKVIEAIGEQFDRRTGLTELIYGQTSRQLRSAEEAKLKSDNLSIRPDDMANKVEDAMSDLSRQEAFASHWTLTPQDVAPIIGPAGAWFWQTYIYTADPAETLYSLEFRVEADSARKPDKTRDAQNMKDAMQYLFQPLLQYGMQSGNTAPVNALVTGWADSVDLDARGFIIPAFTPAPAMPQAQGGAA